MVDSRIPFVYQELVPSTPAAPVITSVTWDADADEAVFTFDQDIQVTPSLPNDVLRWREGGGTQYRNTTFALVNGNTLTLGAPEQQLASITAGTWYYTGGGGVIQGLTGVPVTEQSGVLTEL